MQYNTELHNDGVIPLPYAVVHGADTISANLLHKDKPMFLNVQHITGLGSGQLALQCVTPGAGAEEKDQYFKIVVPTSVGLRIKPIK